MNGHSDFFAASDSPGMPYQLGGKNKPTLFVILQFSSHLLLQKSCLHPVHYFVMSPEHRDDLFELNAGGQKSDMEGQTIAVVGHAYLLHFDKKVNKVQQRTDVLLSDSIVDISK